MAIDGSQTLIRFHQLIATGRPPQRADRSAGGLLPTRAFRFCEAVTTASAFGWYVFPPMSFSLLWTGEQVAWTFEGAGSWFTIGRTQFPDFAEQFDAAAPDGIRGFSPPFLAALPEPGVVQVWSGLLARTAPEWSLLLRPPANLPRPGYDLFEGIVETDRWFGPLFTNVRLTRTDTPITFEADYPLFQVQPLHRSAYADERLQFDCATGLDALSPSDWAAYARTTVHHGNAAGRPLGGDAAAVRRRRRGDVTSPQPG